ncbi:unnamed protein product, partial [Cylicostephanus goldi]
DAFWGPGEPYADDGRIEVFKVNISDEEIDSLKSLITPNRLVAPLEGCSKSQTTHDLMRNLSEVMISFDWKQHQHFLNTFKQYRTGNFLDTFSIEVKNLEAIGDALNSSPLGTASYLMSVWSLFSSRDPLKPLSQLFTLDELATVSYLHYVTETTPRALRIMDTMLNNDDESQRLQVLVPTGLLQSPETPWSTTRSICQHRYLNITSFTEVKKGGVFQHLQDPQAFAADVFRFVELTLLHK